MFQSIFQFFSPSCVTSSISLTQISLITCNWGRPPGHLALFRSKESFSVLVSPRLSNHCLFFITPGVEHFTESDCEKIKKRYYWFIIRVICTASLLNSSFTFPNKIEQMKLHSMTLRDTCGSFSNGHLLVL